MDKIYYKVPENLLISLLRSQTIYSALQNGGVDNWHYYCDSIQEFLKAIGVKDIDDIVYKNLKNFEEIK